MAACIIAGGRDITDYRLLMRALADSGFIPHITEVYSGRASGADALGERWAHGDLFGCPVTPFPADWKKHGKAAGPLRNAQMAMAAHMLWGSQGMLIALWDGKSRGTANMIECARTAGLRIYVQHV